jgi:hypothetical protein
MADNQQPGTKQDLIDLETKFKQNLVDFKSEILEAMRDMQTELLRGMERFARGNYTRMHRLESSDVDINERVNLLEERVMALETRPPSK